MSMQNNENIEKNIAEIKKSESKKRKKMRFLASVGLVTILSGIICLMNLFRKSFTQLFWENDEDDDWDISEDNEI